MHVIYVNSPRCCVRGLAQAKEVARFGGLRKKARRVGLVLLAVELEAVFEGFFWGGAVV